jgi:release factor glutamine methyltransferase
MTLLDRIGQARDALIAAGIQPAEAHADAEVLARHALGWDRARLIARLRDAGPVDFPDRFEPLIARRLAREPVSQITGRREFWGRDFFVTRDVMTPRPETELIVEAALGDPAAHVPNPTIVDVCTGSGCLAVTLAAEIPSARVFATDISSAALLVARRNAERHRVASRIRFSRADLVEGLTCRAHLVVCNPPYVAATDAAALPPEVREFEPHEALFAGQDGLDVFRRLLPAVAPMVRPEAPLIVEVGYDQHAAVSALAADYGWRRQRMRKDLQGIVRTLILWRV